MGISDEEEDEEEEEGDVISVSIRSILETEGENLLRILEGESL